MHAPRDYTQEDIAHRVKATTGVVVVQPLRNTEVPVEISIWNREPTIHFAEWQHVVVAPLEITSGTIQIHECTGGALAELGVEPGHYTARILFNGLGTLSEDGLKGRDFYSVQIWPGETPDLKVFKSWEG
ncbi:hypothetical protein [Haloferula sp. BvORR071]|uniref:hypothetical protein n=1 Tax=Haloferula sp. BvORR071 TaxID=1396141 RepID=UPI00069725F4|nr:hypothetical protein [Haloferula sp. BvORR071]